MSDNTNFGAFNTDDPNAPCTVGPRSPTIGQLQSSPFLPTYIQTPDQGVQLSYPGGVTSTIPQDPILNRTSLGIDSATPNITNTASVQTDNQAIEAVLNTATQPTAKTLSTFVPNALDNYDNVTYNFKLYMAPEGQLLNPNANPSGPFYIVAQSGVSANFYIKDVEIESIVAPNSRTRNINSQIFRMSIIEPQGVSLIDKLISAAAALGIKNINICPMVLELTFKGYLTSGQAAPTTPLTRTWRVTLQDIATSLNEGGAEYKLNFILLQDHAFNRFSAAAIIQQQLTFPVTTVGQFFADLGYYLTLQSARVAANGQIARSEYVFNVAPQMATWKIGELSSDRNTPSMFVEQGDKRSIVLNTDMTIDRIVDLVLATTKEGNIMINPSSDLQKMDKQPNAPKISQIANIKGKVEFLGYAAVANDYVRKYTYYINKYDTFRTIIDKPTQDDQPARIQYLLQDALKKKYQYMFTGQNTDVLKLELDLNNLWRASNVYYANALQRKNNVNSKFVSGNAKTSTTTTPDDLRQNVSQNNFAYTPIPGSQDATIMSLTQSNSSSNLTTNQTPIPTTPTVTDPRTNVISSLDQLASSNQINRSQLSTAITQVDQLNQTSSAPVQAQNANAATLPVLTGSVSRLLPSSLGSLLSSLTSSTVNSQNAQGTLIETLNNNVSVTSNNPAILSMYVKQIDPEIDMTRITDNLEQTTNLGRSVFGIITNQLYDNTAYQDLLQISMEIRGDPYWLGESDLEIFNRLSNNTTSTPTKGNFVNYLRGENCLFLTFNTPKTFNEATGFVDVQQADLFVGVYTVITVLHTFSEGKFTQKLDCIRDIQTNPKVLAQYVNVNGPTNGAANAAGLNTTISGVISQISKAL